MNESERGLVNRSAAEVYEEFFLPALFQQFAEPVVNAAGVQPGQRVLDVACGTGAAARCAAERVGPEGAVVGLDVNDGMLAVAQRMAPTIEWKLGRAEALPFESESFDAVTCQFGLMFFEDRAAALREMLRVLRPGRRMSVAVWDAVENSPGYAAMVRLLQRLFGDSVADALRAPFILGDRQKLGAVLNEAQIEGEVTTHEGTARFPSLQAWVYTDIRGWTMADMVDEAQFERLLREAEIALRPFVAQDGSVAFPAPAHIITVSKNGR